ncbi:HAMP domain-containing protein, partial [Candidatus Poribacteria bacterium]
MFRRLKIRIKILIVLSSVAILAVGINGYISYDTGRDSLEEESFNKLTAVREMKANQVEDYFQQIIDQILTFSEDRMIIDAMKSLRGGFRKIDTELGITDMEMGNIDPKVKSYYENKYLPRLNPNLDKEASVSEYWPEDGNTRILQHLYIASNSHETGSKHLLDHADDDSSYSNIHKTYHPVIRSYLEKFGYYDIFLVDHETGHIIYTVFKEVDYGTSLLTGPYRETNFADAFTAAKDATNRDFVKLVDFEPYHPSYNAQASFIASPIYDGEEKVGVLLFQMPIDRINDIMTNKHEWAKVGLGTSGETYIVGDDYALRNQSRFLIEDSDDYFRMIKEIGVPQGTIDKIRNLNSTIGLQEVRTKGTKTALSGETGTQIFPDYRGVSVLSSYKPLNIPVWSWSRKADWVIMSEIDEAEAFAHVHALRNRILFWFAALIAVIVVIAFLFSGTITRPLKELTRYSQELSHHDFEESDSFQFSGDLNTVAHRGDEVGDLAQAFQRMEAELEDSIENLKNTTSAKERMESELNVGREIQMSMLPLIFPAFPERSEFAVHAHLLPAREVGGDFYDFFFIDEDRFCLCIG